MREIKEWREDHERRIRNVTGLTNSLHERVNARAEFGSNEELEEIGLITMRVGMLEEHIAHHCEILLLRPELRGFHNASKTVLAKGLSEKLDLYKALVIAAGTLHSINTDGIEKNIGSIKELGEERHTVIHGYLFRRPTDETLIFRNKAKEIPANLEGLQSVSDKCVKVSVSLIKEFVAFYRRLLEKPVTSPDLSNEENVEVKQIGASLANALEKFAKWHEVTADVRRVNIKSK
jgi:hypothetical protein